MRGGSLAVVSILCGLCTLWVFRYFTDLSAVRANRKRLQAHLLEFRLFSDEPRLVWRAQKALIHENIQLFRLLLRPVLILAFPTAWLLIQLDCIYGFTPLPIGQAAVVTAQLEGPLSQTDAGSILQAPPEISVETPPVRVFEDRQISWRVRPTQAVCGSLRFTLRGNTFEKTIASCGAIFLSPRRVRSLWEFLMHPEERRLPTGDVAWLEVAYPKAEISIAGLRLPWIAWFSIISTASALGFGRWSTGML